MRTEPQKAPCPRCEEDRRQLARAPLAQLVRCGCGGRARLPRQRENLPCEDLAAALYLELIAAVQAVVRAHDDATLDDDICDCQVCDDARHQLYALQVFESLFTCMFVPKPTPDRARRLAQALAEGRAEGGAADEPHTALAR